MSDLLQHVHFEVRSEWIGQPHVVWKCTKNQVAHLYTVRRDDITEGIVVITQELWEVV